MRREMIKKLPLQSRVEIPTPSVGRRLVGSEVHAPQSLLATIRQHLWLIGPRILGRIHWYTSFGVLSSLKANRADGSHAAPAMK